MSKTITLVTSYPNHIHAVDSDGQWMNVIRISQTGQEKLPSDSDQCLVTSGRNDPHDPQDVQTGHCTWAGSFLAIADFMNMTQLDRED